MFDANSENHVQRTPPQNLFRNPRFKKHLCFGIAILFGSIHYYYVSSLFENDRNFSYLSELEREMSFRTEMGFYYSYYKTIINENQLIVAFTKLMHDRTVEYPKEVNAFNRFNIHPEVLIGISYRYLKPWLNKTDPRVCHLVSRGDLNPIESCVGLSEPIFFYLEVIWWLAGLSLAILVMFAFYFSGSLAGAVLAGLLYAANHDNITRVQWTPNERENFAYPFLLLQMWLLTYQLRVPSERKSAFGPQLMLLLVNTICLCFWQFTQFIFLTQMAVLFVMEQLYIIDLTTFCLFLHSHFCGLHIATFFLQGNNMLKTSFFSAFFLVVLAYTLFFSYLRFRIRKRVHVFLEGALIAIRLILAVALSIWLKMAMSKYFNIEEDSHVLDILYSKLTNYKNFHTMLYTCAPVFDFMSISYFMEITETGLLPIAVLSMMLSFYEWFVLPIASYKSDDKTEETDKKPKKTKNDNASDGAVENDVDIKKVKSNTRKNSRNDESANDNEEYIKDLKEDCKAKTVNDPLVVYLKNIRIDPSVFYHFAQMTAFGILAVLIMRLKLLFTPHMCLVASLTMRKIQFTRKISLPGLVTWALVCALVAMAVYSGKKNIQKEMSHVGEFSDPEQEALLTWIKEESSPAAVFAGPMPLMAAVMLSTRRAVANTPHYEHVDARVRTYNIYKVYGRFTNTDLYNVLRKLQVTHLVVEKSYCYGRSKRGCTFEEIWDTEVPALRRWPRLCHRLLTEELEHFFLEYETDKYAVFRVHDYSVRYTPRLYDT